MPSGTERSKEGKRERSADESLGALAADSGAVIGHRTLPLDPLQRLACRQVCDFVTGG